MRLPWFVLALASLTTGAQQTELSPARIAEVQLAEERALAAVEAEFGNRPPSELTADQRRALIRARAAASADVLRQRGIDARTYARRTATLSRTEQKRVAEARAELLSKTHVREESDVEIVRGPEADERVVEPGAATQEPIEIAEGSPAEAGAATFEQIEIVKGVAAEGEAAPATTDARKSRR